MTYYQTPRYWVYFITDDRGHVKIGKTNDVRCRLSELQTGNPYKLRVLLTIPTATESQAFALETALHRKFAKDRMEGEWFSDTHIQELLKEDDWDIFRKERGNIR